MDEIIVRVARAIASLPRLRLLSCLARGVEVNPKKLAEKLQMPANAVSTHLRTLLGAGLVQRRRSGAWSYYKADSPYGENTLSGKLTTWLRSALHASTRARKNPGLQEVRDGFFRPGPDAHADAGDGASDDAGADPESLLHTIVFEAATAFTDLRRLQILRHLDRQGAVTTQHIVADLSMSAQAASRHITKLRRRGYVRTRDGQADACHLVHELNGTFKTPVHAEMFAIVRSVWKTRQSRTS
jgi:DNA-binding transcriptional ArsR family regulator